MPEWAAQTLTATPINATAGSRDDHLAQALQQADALEADERVFVLGEDIGVYGGALRRHRRDGGGVRGRADPRHPHRRGQHRRAAIGGRPDRHAAHRRDAVLDFVTLAMDQIVNQAAKIRFMFGGKATVPMVLRLPAGSGTGAAAQHSQSLESLLVNVPGLKVVMPSTAYDAKGLLLAAIADNNPVMFVESKLLYKLSGPVPEAPYIIPLGKADIKRPGRDLTIVATGVMVSRALEAAEIWPRRASTWKSWTPAPSSPTTPRR